MIWVILAILVAGWIIAKSIKDSMWEATATPGQKVARYSAEQKAETAINIRKMCREIHELCRGGRSNDKIAGNPKVQKFAMAAGIDIQNGESIRDIKRSIDFLIALDLLDKFKAKVASGESDEKIAHSLGREYQGYLTYKCYEPDDIRAMRSTILGQ